MAGGPPAENGAATTSPDCGEVAGFGAWRAVPHAVDGPMLAQERARPHALLDLIARDPRAKQLPARDHTMRARPQLSKRSLDGGHFRAHCAR